MPPFTLYQQAGGVGDGTLLTGGMASVGTSAGPLHAGNDESPILHLGGKETQDHTVGGGGLCILSAPSLRNYITTREAPHCFIGKNWCHFSQTCEENQCGDTVGEGAPSLLEPVDTFGMLTFGWWAQTQDGCHRRRSLPLYGRCRKRQPTTRCYGRQGQTTRWLSCHLNHRQGTRS